ncbi:MAG: nicotinate-nucleotide adenylyltransferase [Actinobacteria bacterium]|jgi:nicotinate-nucleotide adenylyltransferase|nr:nicotinate-nucleotide adenylyltransferase [Actinomycetota bacterium]
MVNVFQGKYPSSSAISTTLVASILVGMRVGILGGTFDPIHIGHLIAASSVYEALKLDSVVFMPAGDPWQKRDRELSTGQQRLEMVKLATSDDARFQASDIEISRSGPTYAIDTVREWKRRNPEDELFWIVGSDALSGIPSWHEWEAFVSEVTVIAVNRIGQSASVPFEVVSVEMPEVRISATQLRDRFTNKLDTQYLVPPKVSEYISDQGLYQA